MIDIDPTRCMRTAEELSGTRRALLQQADVLSGVCGSLRSSTDESMHEIARTIERYISDIEMEGRASETISLMLGKIAESYMRTERDAQEYIEEVYVTPVTYQTVVLGDVTMKAKQLFEDF